MKLCAVCVNSYVQSGVQRSFEIIEGFLFQVSRLLSYWQKFVYPYQISCPVLVVTTWRVLTDIHQQLKFIPKQTCAVKT